MLSLTIWTLELIKAIIYHCQSWSFQSQSVSILKINKKKDIGYLRLGIGSRQEKSECRKMRWVANLEQEIVIAFSFARRIRRYTVEHVIAAIFGICERHEKSKINFKNLKKTFKLTDGVINRTTKTYKNEEAFYLPKHLAEPQNLHGRCGLLSTSPLMSAKNPETKWEIEFLQVD